MLNRLMDTARFVESGLKALPLYVEDQGPDAWAESFARRRKASRQLLGEAIVRSGNGTYMGDIGDHGLCIRGTAVTGDGGYEQLMDGWLNVARGSAGAA